jgi:hypothetical protein
LSSDHFHDPYNQSFIFQQVQLQCDTNFRWIFYRVISVMTIVVCIKTGLFGWRRTVVGNSWHLIAETWLTDKINTSKCNRKTIEYSIIWWYIASIWLYLRLLNDSALIAYTLLHIQHVYSPQGQIKREKKTKKHNTSMVKQKLN